MNVRNLLIIAVIITIGAFAYKWFDGFGLKFGESEQRVNELDAKYKKLQAAKDSSDKKIVVWRSKYDSLRGEGARLKGEVDKFHRESVAAQITAAKSKAQLDSAKVRSERLKAKIVQMEQSPANRTGDELIQSLKNKLK